MWGWRVRRLSLQGRTIGRFWYSCSALCIAAMVAFWGLHLSTRSQISKLHSQIAEVLAAMPVPPPTKEPAARDFAQSLGAPLLAAPAIEELQRACAASGLLLASIQADERSASAEQLGRLDLIVALRGPYPGMKLVLKHMLESFPTTTLQRIRIRKSQVAADADIGFTLSIWSKPSLSNEAPARSAFVATEH